MGGPCSRSDADQLAARLVRSIGETFHVEGRELRIGASIGVTFVANPGAVAGSFDMDKLLHQADTALYRAKEGGRRTHSFYEWSPIENLLLGTALMEEATGS
jgi:GGDEF domain-containing protein